MKIFLIGLFLGYVGCGMGYFTGYLAERFIHNKKNN